MGIGIKFSSGTCKTPQKEINKIIKTYDKNRKINISIDATNFKVWWKHYEGNFMVALVEYPECSNYDGLKLLVFEGLKEIPKELDPHFLDNNKFLIARFRPEEKQVTQALELIKSLNKSIK
jgi:hypothetical protein